MTNEEVLAVLEKIYGQLDTVLDLLEILELQPRFRRTAARVCRVKDCDREARARGLCQGHYQRLYIKGDVLEAYPIRPQKRANP